MVAVVFPVAVKVPVPLVQPEIGLLEDRFTGAVEATGFTVAPTMPRDFVLSNSTGIVRYVIALELAL
jgi:hypothetical protein